MKKTLSRWLVTATMILLTGCGNTVTWQEEVLLSDGRVVVVERATLRVSGGPELAHGGSGTVPQERRIRFEFPIGSGRTVEWHSTKIFPDLVPEHPLVLDIQQGIPVILGSLSQSAGCNRYLKYLYIKGQWVEESLPAEFEATPTNLSLLSGPSMPSLIKLADKRGELNDPGYARRLKQVGPHPTLCHG